MLPSMSVYLKVFSPNRQVIVDLKCDPFTPEEALFEFIRDTKGIWVSETGTYLLNEM